jgi:hypothetical protein
MHFLPINRQSVLSYCARLLIHILKDRSLQPTQPGGDAAIGHIIVLLQVFNYFRLFLPPFKKCAFLEKKWLI